MRVSVPSGFIPFGMAYPGSHEKTSEIIPDHEFDSLMKLPELLSHI